jgi:hypothetical protein
VGQIRKQGYNIPGIFGVDYSVKMWISEVEHQDFDYMIQWCKDNVTWEKNNVGGMWKTYNCFTLDHPTIKTLKKDIYKEYLTFMKELGEEPEEIYINGWFNIYDKDQGQGAHYHNHHNSTYLSGIVVLTQNESATDFLAPKAPNITFEFDNPFNYDVIEIQNHKGQLILFPQWTYHGVRRLKENKRRVTVGFDIFTKNGMKLIKKEYDENHMYRRAVNLSE